jgi:hypothetical protein
VLLDAGEQVGGSLTAERLDRDHADWPEAAASHSSAIEA